MERMSVTTPAVAALLADLQRIFTTRLGALVVYGGQQGNGPTRCLALVEALSAQDLEACASHARAWQKAGLATPLVLPATEFRESLDAFPLEYGAIIRWHHVAFGPDPFTDTHIGPEDTRRACETQVRSHLVHVREGYIEAANSPRDVAALISASVPAFAALLRHVAWLCGDAARAVASGGSIAHLGAQVAGLPASTVDALLQLEHDAGLASGDAARLFPEYLAALDQLAAFINGWRQP